MHLNHDMTCSIDTIDPSALQMIANAVAFASCEPVFVDGFESGDWSDWAGFAPRAPAGSAVPFRRRTD